MPVDTLARAVLAGGADHGSAELVFAHVGRSGTERADTTTTLGRLVEDAERVAGALGGMGVEPGDVVAVQLPNWYEGAVAQTAVTLLGAVLLPVVQIYGPRELGFVLRQSGAVALVLADTWRGRDHLAMLDAAGPLPALRTVVVVESGESHAAPSRAARPGTSLPDGAHAFTALTGRLARPCLPPGTVAADRALLVYTSGTTAEPKGVRHTHASLLAELRSAVVTRSVRATTRYLALFPSGHVAGVLGLLRPLVHGVDTVVLDGWDSARAAALVDRHRLTAGVAAPIMLAGLLDERDRGTATLDTLREVMTGAAGVSPTLVERADAAGIAAFRCYGSSEHPTVSAGNPLDPLAKRAGTDGRVIPGCEVRLVDDNGADVAPGEQGEVVSRGPDLFAGYTDPALDRWAFLPGGWYRSGDLGRFDPDGHLTITDRKKDIIIRGGENISAKEVEDILGGHPKVLEVAAVGVPDERYGERVAVFVITRAGVDLEPAEVGAHFDRAGVAKQKTPEHVVLVDELPRTAAGKVRKYQLRERFVRRSFSQHRSGAT